MTDSTIPQLSDTEVFDILQNPRRRAVLRCLHRADGEMAFDDLIDQVAIWETNSSIEELETAQRRRVYVSLTQSHIPKLEQAGVIAYHEDDKIVERRPAARQLDTYLDVHSGNDNLWPVVYLTAGLGSLGLTAAHWFQLPVINSLSQLLLSAGIVGLFLVLSVAHLVQES